MSVFSRLRNIAEEASAFRGIILRRSRRSNVRQDPSINAADGEPSEEEPNASVRLVADATDPDRALAVRVGGAWHFAQLSAAADTAMLDEHLDGGAGKHDATEVDYERADGSKKNIAAGSDTVEAALTNLDDATGALSDLSTTVKTSVVAAVNEVRDMFGTANAATANGTGVALSVSAEGAVKRVRLTLTNTPVVLADNPGVVAYGSLKVLDFPEGYIQIMGLVANLALTKSSAGVNNDWDGDFGVGTVAADNGATLATNEQNLIASTSTPQAVAGATTAKGFSTTGGAIFNGSSTPVDVFLNILVDDTDHDVTTTPCNIVVNGTIDVTYCLLGDV